MTGIDDAVEVPPTCLAPGCLKTKLMCRGLCRSHYQYVAKAVQADHTSWEAMEKAGKVLPRKWVGPDPRMLKWLEPVPAPVKGSGAKGGK